MERRNGGFLTSQVRQLSGRVFEQILKEANISEFNGAQGRILYVLWQEDNLTITRIGELTSLAKTSLTSMLDRMEQSGLIERKKDPKNRRITIISLTKKAHNLKKDYHTVSNKMDEIFYLGFNDEQVDLFEKMLKKIISNLEEYEKGDKNNE